MATWKLQNLKQMLTIKKISIEKQRLHVVGVAGILANCQSARKMPRSASPKKPCSETEDKKKMTIQIRMNKFIRIPTLYEP